MMLFVMKVLYESKQYIAIIRKDVHVFAARFAKGFLLYIIIFNSRNVTFLNALNWPHKGFVDALIIKKKVWS